MVSIWLLEFLGQCWLNSHWEELILTANLKAEDINWKFPAAPVSAVARKWDSDFRNACLSQVCTFNVAVPQMCLMSWLFGLSFIYVFIWTPGPWLENWNGLSSFIRAELKIVYSQCLFEKFPDFLTKMIMVTFYSKWMGFDFVLWIKMCLNRLLLMWMN